MTSTTAPRETPARRDVVNDEWQIDTLDMDAYLRRIGYDGPREATPGVLRDIHRAHAGAIPFENLDILLGRGISLDLERVQEKLVASMRGGYCYEHNLLLSAVLTVLGFDVRRLIARVQPDKPGPRTHMMLNVRIDGQVWLTDVGFGAALLEPIPLGATVRQGEWTYGTRRRDDGTWALRDLSNGDAPDLYAFSGELQHRVDYDIANHFTATHPSSPFVDQAVAMRTTPQERFTLRGLTLTTTRAGGMTDERLIDPEGLGEVLRATFGIALGEDEIVRVRDHAVKGSGHDPIN